MTSSSYITKGKLHEVLKSEAERASKVVAAMHFQHPYPSQVTKPYPKDYVKPKFRLFDGKKSSAREYVKSFIDDWESIMMIMILD